MARGQRGPRQRQPTAGTDAKREAILRAAESLFHTQGYARTTIDQVAERLGVTKPFVYYYFRNKQELFETLSWTPAVACFTVLDDGTLDQLPAHQQAAQALERLIRATLAHYPAAFFSYREPQAYRPEYLAEQKRLAHHFYDKFCALLERGRAEGTLRFAADQETRITALAACSLPGFLYSWYRPEGRLPAEAVVQQLSRLAWRVIGLADMPDPTPTAQRRRCP
ncbi:TetR/AcrR family transcriptional regulator [Ideonella sp. DXS22W]|uniref:TetR/AcrR family transcriptional regulator n=1 Tax=Pseudaquabacterium inlustre TaxID=2984192 RepID=A0ABU9CS24_9BURK